MSYIFIFMSEIITNYWERIDEVLKKKELSLTLLATNIGIKKDTIFTWRNRCQIPNPAAMISISNELGVSIDYLLKGNDEEEIPEVIAVKTNSTIRALVKKCMEDPRLISALELLIDDRKNKNTPAIQDNQNTTGLTG